MKAGDIVRYNPEWCDEDERKYFFVVMEVYEDREQALIKILNSESIIKKQELVSFEMIERTGENVA